MKKKDIVKIVLFSCFCVLCVASLIVLIQPLKYYIVRIPTAITSKAVRLSKVLYNIFIWLLPFILSILSLGLAVWNIIKVFKNSNFPNQTKYTYEKYLENKKRKMESKKAKLEKKIEEMEKTE